MSATPPLPQLTLKAIVLGLILSMVLAGANAYLGLFAGMTVSASIPAAVISMAILKLFKESNILENNIVQTAASAGESLAAGVIFTLPALIILGYWNVFAYPWVAAIAGLGGLLGVLFTIPLRRSLIVEEKLAYPEGTATAEVLKVGAAPGQGARLLAIAAILGALTKFAETGLRLWASSIQTAGYLGSSTIAYVGMNLSPALISVGFIVGLNIAVLVFLGGAISWYVAIPIYSGLYLDSDPALAAQFAAGTGATDSGVRDLDLQDPLPGRRRDADRRYLGAGVHARVPFFRHSQRTSDPQREHRRRLRPHRARHPHETGDLGRGRVRHPHLFPLPGHRRRGGRGACDDRDHGDHGIPVLLGGRLHGGTGGVVQQPYIGNHHCDHSLHLAAAGLAYGRRCGQRTRCGDHGRRGSVLRGRHRGRQPSGPEGRLHRRGRRPGGSNSCRVWA